MNKLTQSLTRGDKLRVHLQRIIAFVAFPVMYGLMVLSSKLYFHYRVTRMRALRQQYQQYFQNDKRPIIICANHIGFMDPFMLVWTLSSPWTFLLHFKRVPWNLPKAKHAYKSLFSRLVCYIGKTIPLADTSDPGAMQKALAKFKYVMRLGDSLMIFPEGKRSKTGRIDTESFGYGVGQILMQNPNARVLCAYLRNTTNKENNTGFAPVNSCFTIELALIQPTTGKSGLRGVRELSTQVRDKLLELEQEHVAASH